MLTQEILKPLVEAVLFSTGKPLTCEQILALFTEQDSITLNDLRHVLQELQDDYGSISKGVELVESASGYKFQAKIKYASWISKLWEEKSSKYSRALLETLAIIAYKQPVTRGEIEEIRGVSISTSIFKTLLDERSWIRVVGHKDVPGKPGLYATTRQFLDYFGLKRLEELPSLPEILSLEELESKIPEQLELPQDEQTTEIAEATS